MNYYNEIKNELINNEITKRVKNYYINKSDLNTYYNVGKLLADAGKHYGEGIIKNYSKRLTEELGKGYTTTSLKRMRQFYNIIEKGALLGHQLTWSHYRELIPLKDINKINYYVNICLKNSITRDELKSRIKSKEYERLPKDTKVKLINKEDNKIEYFIKNPIIIHNKNNYDVVSEKILKKLILEDIESFMKELGNYYSFVGSEYKIKIGNTYNYIDLLLFNYEYNCFVVIELKITSLKKEHIGQIEIYMNYIDNNLKKINMDKTIVIIIVKKDNRYIMEYCSDKRILSKEYITI